MALSADLLFALRTWRRNPIPPLTAVVTLALGVGVNTAIFSVIHAVMLKPLPYPEPGRLAQIWVVDPDSQRNHETLSSKELDCLRKLARTFQDIGYYRPWMSNLSGEGEANRIHTVLVSPGFLTALGAAPALGRAFTAADMAAGNDRIVILSDGFWRRRFGADPAILGRTVTVDGFPCKVVGVLGPASRLIAHDLSVQPDLVQPISVITDIHRHPESAFAFGRLRGGDTLAAARAELNALVRQLRPEDDPRPPGKHGLRSIELVSMTEDVASSIRPALLILFAAAGCVLLLACCNIASLLVGSVSAREGELALRTALGARRGRLACQLLTETTALTVAGTALGMPLSFWAVLAIVHLYPERIPRIESLRPEPAVFAFAALLAVVTAILCGGLPAWRYSRADVQPTIQRSLAGVQSGGGRLRDVLTTVQIGVALVLLVGAGLLMRSFALLRAVDPGYRRNHLLLAHMMLDDKDYREPQSQAAFVQRLIACMQTVPGVEAVAATDSLPLDFNFLMQIGVGMEGHPELADHAIVDSRSVTAGYIQTMGIPLLAGRYLTPADEVVGGGMIVNQSFARRYFGTGTPIGRHIYTGKEARPIVGVVADIRDLHLDREAKPTIYSPFNRLPTPFVDLVLRTTSEPKLLVKSVRAQLRAIDPNQPLGQVTTMEDVLESAVAKPRWYALLTGSFAGLALLLAAVGTYGVVASAVSQRTHEIGIRMAVGAQPRQVLHAVVRRAMIAPLAGVLIGLLSASAASRVLSSFLYGVTALDSGTYVAVALLVLVVSLMAAYVPARRAAVVDPIAALRRE